MGIWRDRIEKIFIREHSRKKNQLIIFLISFFIFFIPLVVFSQGREYQRHRSASVIEEESLFEIEEEAQPEYYIVPGDIIEIFVWQNPELTRVVSVRPDGKLSYPLLGTIKAAGFTIDELQNIVKEKLSQYIRTPEVTVSIKETKGNKIIMLGEVSSPGIYTYEGSINLLEAIAMAGDFTNEGKRESVIVVSDNLTEHPKVRRVNLFLAIREGTSKEDIVLKPNDLVYVPRRFISDFNRFLSDIQPTVDKAMSVFDWRRELRTWYKHRD